MNQWLLGIASVLDATALFMVEYSDKNHRLDKFEPSYKPLLTSDF